MELIPRLLVFWPGNEASHPQFLSLSRFILCTICTRHTIHVLPDTKFLQYSPIHTQQPPPSHFTPSPSPSYPTCTSSTLSSRTHPSHLTHTPPILHTSLPPHTHPSHPTHIPPTSHTPPSHSTHTTFLLHTHPSHLTHANFSLNTYPSHLTHTTLSTQMYKDPLVKQGILSVKEAEQLFPSLEELILFHSEERRE